jgi:long-chain acyl-CoA synthetase
VNIAHHVERAARFFPTHPAIHFEETATSYADLNTRASRLASALIAHGVKAGERVAVYLPNIPEFVLCYLAGLKVGAVVVSINATFKSDEVRHILNDAGARVVFTAGDLLPNVPVEECPALKHLVVCAGEAQGNARLDEWAANGAGHTSALS